MSEMPLKKTRVQRLLYVRYIERDQIIWFGSERAVYCNGDEFLCRDEVGFEWLVPRDIFKPNAKLVMNICPNEFWCFMAAHVLTAVDHCGVKNNATGEQFYLHPNDEVYVYPKRFLCIVQYKYTPGPAPAVANVMSLYDHDDPNTSFSSFV